MPDSSRRSHSRELSLSAELVRRLKTRRRLRELNAYELDDIGVTEHWRLSECAKWFWQT